MKIYVIRHGQTDINIQNKINALNDVDLNSEGVRQAKNLADKIKDIDYDFIISSPLIRTIHTAELLNIKNKEMILDKRIQERDAGYLTEQPVSLIRDEDWWSVYPKNDYKDAETVINVIQRVKIFLDEIKVRYKNKNIIIVTHGGVSKAIKVYFEGIPDDGNINTYEHDNCEILQYEL